MNMKLTNDQNNAINAFKEFLESDDQVFLLKGSAGTGKTTLMKMLVGLVSELQKYFFLTICTKWRFFTTTICTKWRFFLTAFCTKWRFLSIIGDQFDIAGYPFIPKMLKCIVPF